MPTPTFHSTRPFDADIDLPAVAVYCSDGRFASACEQFIENHLQIERCDRLVVPGGPGALAGHAQTGADTEAMAGNLRFLADAHKLDRLVLIAHDCCAFYLDRLGVAEHDLIAQQRRDAAAATQTMRSLTGIKRVDAYRATIVDDHVAFEAMAID